MFEKFVVGEGMTIWRREHWPRKSFLNPQDVLVRPLDVVEPFSAIVDEGPAVGTDD